MCDRVTATITHESSVELKSCEVGSYKVGPRPSFVLTARDSLHVPIPFLLLAAVAVTAAETTVTTAIAMMHTCDPLVVS